MAVPLAVALPQGAPGCTLLVSPAIVELQVPVAGRVTARLALPNTSALAGFLLRQQVVTVDFAVGGSLSSIASSNALELTLGTL